MAQERKIDLNTASRDELLAVPGINPVRADAIIRYREEHGGFRSVDDLKNLPGFEEDAGLGVIQEHLTVSAAGGQRR
jgi:competence protein ComEA